MFNTNNKKIDIKFENDIVSKTDIKAPKCFAKKHPINSSENIIINNIQNIVIKNKIFKNANKFNSDNTVQQLITDYNEGKTNILELSSKYDLPPLYLLNIIFKKKYDKNILYISKNKHILADLDYKIFNIAYNNDLFTIENKIDKNLFVYKEFIKMLLYKNNIKFIENDFWFELEDFDYDGKKITWILYSNEYGSCITKLYENVFNSNLIFIQSKYKNKNGIVLFENNFCSELSFGGLIQTIFLPIDNNFMTNNITIKETSKDGDFYKFGLESKTDKVTHHHYWKYYPLFLEKYRKIISNNKDIKYGMMEIGINHYRSIKLWEKYFPESFIYGLDIGFDGGGKNYEIFKCDQSDLIQLTNVSNTIIKQNKIIFFIIDDGSHHPDHQIKTFNLFFDKLLAYGGCYIIEDIETSYWSKNDIYGYETKFGYKNKNSAIEIAKNLIDDVNSEFLSEDNKKTLTDDFNLKINPYVRSLISNIFFGQNNIIITKKNLEDLEINKREYRFSNNL